MQCTKEMEELLTAKKNPTNFTIHNYNTLRNIVKMFREQLRQKTLWEKLSVLFTLFGITVSLQWYSEVTSKVDSQV